MNRRMLAVLALSVLVGLLGVWGLSCARKPAQNAVTIWWAQWAPSDGLQELGNEFEKETGIKVIVHQIPWGEYQNQVFQNFGKPQTDFDIVVGDSQWIGRGATKGLYLELTDWLASAVDLKTVHPNVLKYICQYPSDAPAGQERYYAAPCESDAVGFAYRKDWFEDPANKAKFQEKFGRELTVPDTWEQFRQVAEFFTDPSANRYGCALLTGRDYDSLVMGYQHFMWQWGGSWGDPKAGKMVGAVNSDGAVKGLEAMIDLLKFAPPGKENLHYGQVMEMIQNNSTAMIMDYFAFFPELANTMGEKVGFFVMPANVDKRIISLGGQGMSISTKVSAQQQDKAKKFIAWFLQRQIQEKWVTKPAGFTANTEILASEEFRKATPYNAPLAASMDYLQDFPNVPQYDDLLTVAREQLGRALDGLATPKQALDTMAQEQEKIMAQAGGK